jgi:hypothetical protein
MFADWTGSNTNDWRTNGAQLIFDWETYQLAVADKTGSNILFYAGNGVTNGTVQAFCTLDWFDDNGVFDFGAFTETRSAVNPGSDTWSLSSYGFFELSFNDSSNPGARIDLIGLGPNKENHMQKWDINHTFTMWTDTENFRPFGAGGRETFNGTSGGNPRTTFSGVINANGKGTGANPFFPLD